MKHPFPYLFFILLSLFPLNKVWAQSKVTQPKTGIKWIDQRHQENLPDSLRLVNQKDTAFVFNEIRAYILHQYYYSGYFSGKIDSIKLRTSQSSKSQYYFYSNRGLRYRIGSLNITSDADSDSAEILPHWHPRYLFKSKPYSQKLLEEGINHLIQFYEDHGYALVKVFISNFKIDPSNRSVHIQLRVHRGGRIIVSGVMITNVHKNDPDYLARITGIKDSSLVTPHLLATGRTNLQNSNLFDEVGKGDIVKEDNRYYVEYRVKERNPNSFDLLVGYVPNPGRGGTIVGNGELLLRNAIWNGSKLNLSFNRLQKYVTKLNIGFSKEWLLNIPLGVGMNFHFLQQDSSYQVRNLKFNGSYNINSATQVLAIFRRQTVAVNSNIINLPPVLSGNGTYGGLGLNYQNVDNLLVPRHGMKLSIMIQSGLKRISDNSQIQDTTRSRIHQKILQFNMQPYFNPFRRQVFTLSIHAYFIESDGYTESDLIRFGGAKSLRGYREDQFMASRMLWGDAEYRYLLDPTSYAFIFGAEGTYLRPRISIGNKTVAKTVGWLHSFGFGFAFQTKLGQLKITYAKSPQDTFSNAKIHISISGNL
ncbi:MAG TPA: POTRA domain-containing protein [Balneolales bacterium]|nr:POTRA domain-containing protein [Balneolales bacterium]